MNFQIIKSEDYDNFAQVMLSSYPQSHPLSTEKFMTFMTDIYEHDNSTFYISKKNKSVLGGMRIIDYNLNLRNAILTASGIGSVCVSPLHRKEHVAKEIIQFYLHRAYDQSKAFAVLYPFRRSFYKSMGFGYGCKFHKYMLSPINFPIYNTKESLSYLNKADLAEVMACYNRHFQKTNGMLSKTDLDYLRYLSSFNYKVIGCKQDGEITGFIIYEYKNPSNRNTYEGNIEIIDYVYNNLDTLNQLLYFLHSQKDQISRIGIISQDDSFDFKFIEAQNEQSHVFGDFELESYTTATGLMYRITSFTQLIEELKDTTFDISNITIAFNISDNLLVQNHGIFTVSYNNGLGVLTNDKPQVQVNIDISELSSLFIGSIGFRQLFELGLVSLDQISYVSQLDKMFSYYQKPQCTTKF